MSRSRSGHEDRKRSKRKRSHRSRSRSRSRSPSRRSHNEDDDDERRLREAKEYLEREARKEKMSSSRKEDDDDDRKRSHRHDDDDHNKKRSKRRSHRHSDSSDVSDSEGDRRKKHRKEEDRREDKDKDRKESKRKHHHSSSGNKDRKHHKHDRKKESKHHRSKKKEEKKKSKKKERDEKKQSSDRNKKIKKPDKSTLTPLGAPLGKPPAQLLDAEKDYFAYHKHLWVWLYREEGVAFNDLTSEESHEAFARFVQQYNQGALEAAYYSEEGLPAGAIDECKTTRHKWSFQTSETERKGLQMLQDGVRKLTEYREADNNNNEGSNNSNKHPAPTVAPRVGPSVPERNQQADQAEADNRRRRQWTDEERTEHRRANKRLKEDIRVTEEEFAGGKADYGRERQLEKKRETAAKIHGAAKDREDPGVTMNDDALYGDGGHGASFQVALAREKQRKAKREGSKQARIQELQQKEHTKQQEMLKKLGLTGIQAGKKIQIAPRNDEK